MLIEQVNPENYFEYTYETTKKHKLILNEKNKKLISFYSIINILKYLNYNQV